MSKTNFNDFRKFAMNTKVNGQYASGLTVDDYFKYLDKNQHKFNMPIDYQDVSIVDPRFTSAAIISVYSRLVQDRIIFVSDIENETASIIVAQLLYLSNEDNDKDVSIYINSMGGSCYDGAGIISTMQFIPNTINTVVTGCALSYGAIIAVAGDYGHRSITNNGTMMLHQPLTGIGTSSCDDIVVTANEIQRIKKDLFQFIATRTGKKIEDIESVCVRDKWLTAQESLDFHLVDNIIQPQKKKIITYNEYLATKDSDE